MKIDYLKFPASDFAAIEGFYSKTFGWTFTSYGEEYHAFNDGSLDGGFFKSDTQSRQASGSTLAILKSDDLESALETVLASGGTLHREIFGFPGGRRFHFLDPHGNELAVWSES